MLCLKTLQIRPIEGKNIAVPVSATVVVVITEDTFYVEIVSYCAPELITIEFRCFQVELAKAPGIE